MINEATDLNLIRELGKLFQAEKHRLKQSFSNELVRHIGFQILKSWQTEYKLYGDHVKKL